MRRAKRKLTGCCVASVLIDLYSVVRNGLRASLESYSIKKLEALYGFYPRSQPS